LFSANYALLRQSLTLLAFVINIFRTLALLRKSAALSFQ
jgi:hypothetical protein